MTDMQMVWSQSTKDLLGKDLSFLEPRDISFQKRIPINL